MQFLSNVPKLVEGRRFFLFLAAIFVVGILFRTIYITADAPWGFTKSQDVSTDPFAYTYFAENKIDYGDANPFDDPRWIVYEKSTQTVAAYLIYAILGTGRAQGNLAAVLLNLIAILLLCLGIKNFGSRLGALLFALIACTSFVLTTFARIPFLEASQNLWLAASFYFFSRGSQKRQFYGLAGAAAAAAAFFGKMIALYALGLFLAVWLFIYFTAERDRRTVIKSAGIFYTSYIAVGIFWFLFTYLPAASEVSAYYAEQGVGLYGAPRAFQELSMFFWQLQSLLWDRNFFEKLPFVSILAAISGAVVIWYLVKSLWGRRIASPLTVGWVLLFIWLIFAYSALFPFNYRPLRYQTTLMFPMMALAGIILAVPFEAIRLRKDRGKRQKAAPPKPIPLAVAWGIWLAPIVCTLFLLYGETSGGDNTAHGVIRGIYVYTFLFFAVGFALALFVRYASRYGRRFALFARILAAATLLGYLPVQVIDFVSWAATREYSLISADRDLGTILADNSVLSGSYASALTQENKLKCIHHQFGVENPDPSFFEKFPITHLLVDPGNDDRAKKDYPRLMNSAELVTSYIVRGMPVKLYRIAGASPNKDARNYEPSDFEWFRHWIGHNNRDSAAIYLDRLIASGKPIYTLEIYLGDSFLEGKQHERAIPHFRTALSLSPYNASVAYRLGLAYANALQKQGDPSYVDSALTYLEIAHNRIPQDAGLKRTIDDLRRSRR